MTPFHEQVIHINLQSHHPLMSLCKKCTKGPKSHNKRTPFQEQVIHINDLLLTFDRCNP